MNIQSELQDIFRDIFDDENLVITRETSAEAIEDWDSLAQMNLMVAIEKHFHVHFKVGEIAGLHNVGEMLELITKQVERKGL